VGRDWPVDGLEFQDKSGTYRFRLEEPIPGGPTLLRRARANDPKAVFEIATSTSKTAIPFLSLLAHQAWKGASAPEQDWIYDLVWRDLGIKTLPNRAPDPSQRERVMKVVPFIRELVGKETIEAVRGGYRLAVPVELVPNTVTSSSSEVSSLTASAPNPLAVGTDPEPDTVTVAPPNSSELRAEQRAKAVETDVIGTSRFQPGAVAAIVGVIGAALFVWFLLGLRSGKSPTAFNYVKGATGATLVVIVVRRLMAKGSTNKITICVARLGPGRAGKAAQESVMESIRSVLGPDVARIQRANIDLYTAEAGTEEEARTYAKARRFLQKQKSDVLIWGRVDQRPQMKDRLFLGFSTPDGNHRPDGSFGFGEDALLEPSFGPELGTTLAAVAGSMAWASLSEGRVFVSNILEPLADKLSRLVAADAQIDPVDRCALRQSLGTIQLAIGNATGDRDRLATAVVSLRAAATEMRRDRTPLSWMLGQNTLGLALKKLGDQQSGTECLEEAAAVFQEAVDASADGQGPAIRAAILHNLATTRSSIGEREASPESLRKAVDAFHQTLKCVENEPKLVAVVQRSLALTLTQLGDREKDTTHVRKAIDLAKRASGTFLRAVMLTDWTLAKIALAGALADLGEREGNAAKLDEAADEFRFVANVMTRKRAPVQWFNIQFRLAAVLLRRGELDPVATAHIREAVKVAEEALRGLTPEVNPALWTHAQNTLGVASMRLGEREDNLNHLKDAEKAFNSVLEVWKRDVAPFQWAMATNSLASVQALLGAKEQGTEKLLESIGNFRDAAEVCTVTTDAPGWAYAQNGLAVALVQIAARSGEKEPVQEAVTALRAVLNEITPEQSPHLVALTQDNLKRAVAMRSALTDLGY
jgi:tetratricopeptide (TPR) repeat protein